jgi:sulfite reductase (ferredoxin)
MPLDELESTIEPLLLGWKAAGGRRSFGDYVAKLGHDQVKELLGAG